MLYEVITLMRIDRALAEAHYAEHKGKAFYDKLIEYTVSSPVIAFALEGDDAILKLRRLCGPTDVKESLPGTIRGDFCFNTRLNIRITSYNVCYTKLLR